MRHSPLPRRSGKKDAYENVIGEISRQLEEKILSGGGDLTDRVKSIDRDVAVIVRDVG